MATKTAVVTQPDAAEAREEGPDAPLLDTLGAELKKLVQKGKERGYVTYDELNAALPPDQVSSEQIEDTMAMLSEAGVNVVEGEEQEEAPAANRRSRPRPPWRRPRRPARTRSSAAPTTRCACTCARWARSSCCRARARSRSPSASRPAAT